ncbi:MAG TPA: PVC-type heme-binding CxxCH protein [Pirellulales bacterium]|nr:PVC-type heme-binding CxxCH protein [Pirellulales bacterium]
MSRCARIALSALCAFALLPLAIAVAQKPPEEELKLIKFNSDDFDVSLFASEPMITNPSAIDVDTQGRVWVAEIQFYRGKAKNPPADKIKVLEDTQGTGKADKVTVFADGVFCPMSVCVAGDKVYVATSPDLWVYDDKNGDLKADGPPKKLLTGFGGYNHDHGAHSLVLGPDHKFYMTNGDTGFKLTGTDGSKIEYKWGAMIRGELDGSKLQLEAVNFRNPYEICVNSFGDMFCSDNDNDGNQSTRICWILEGGNYGWFGSPPFDKKELDKKVPLGTPYRETWHFRGYIPGFVPGTIMTGFGSPAGICYYEGDAFGAKYKNMPWHCDPGPAEVRNYPHEKVGFGMKGSQRVIMTCGDKYFRPVDVCAAPDGSIYIADWYDGGVGGHAYNNPDQGRIFKLTPKNKKLARHEKPGPYSNIPDAIEGLKSPNLATQYLARERLLTEKEQSIASLTKLLTAEDHNFRARALWVLDRIGGAGREPVTAQLKSEDSAFRALAVRILRRHGEEYADRLLAMADDPAPEVEREVLLAVRDLKGEKAEAALAAIAKKYDGTDRYMLEAINIACGDRKEALYQALTKDGVNVRQISLLQLLNPKAASEQLASKLAAGGADDTATKTLLAAVSLSDSPDAGKSLLQLVSNEQAAPELRQLALERLGANLNGNWRALGADDAAVATFKKLLANKALQGTMVAIAGDNGLQKLTPEILAIAKSKDAPLGLRKQAIHAAVELRGPQVVAAFRAILSEKNSALQEVVLNALVDLQDGKTLRDVLANDQISLALRQKTAERLMESTGGALLLLRAVEDQKLSPELQKLVIAHATHHPDANVRILFEKYIPASERPQRLGEGLKADQILALAGDAGRGEKIFYQSSAAQCKNCHAANGRGMNVGPDLSMIGTKYAKEVLLESILDPSKAIAPEYIVQLLETKQGQIYAGFLVEKSDKQVVLKDAKNQLIRIPSDDVEQIVPQKKSMMPELVLKDVTAQDAADLLAYLQTLTKENAEKHKNGK